MNFVHIANIVCWQALYVVVMISHFQLPKIALILLEISKSLYKNNQVESHFGLISIFLLKCQEIIQSTWYHNCALHYHTTSFKGYAFRIKNRVGCYIYCMLQERYSTVIEHNQSLAKFTSSFCINVILPQVFPIGRGRSSLNLIECFQFMMKVNVFYIAPPS